MTEVPWVSVSGYGAHIKASRRTLFVQKRQSVEEYPLDQVKHLLVVGGHTIASSVITRLVREGSCISFFEPDGTPAGIIRPYGSEVQDDLCKLQRETPRQRYAVSLARGSLTSRLIVIERTEESIGSALCYAGELELMHNSLEEKAYLIKLDEIRRLHRLTSDMYYEILARSQPPVLGFRRRTMKPQTDPVNAMLSFGYALLYGACSVAVIGARLDPDYGFLHEGAGSLIQDLIEPLKAGMIDEVVSAIGRKTLHSLDYEVGSDRCLLSDDLMKSMIRTFYTTINAQKVDEQVLAMLTAITAKSEFKARY
ncbi:CRISPR-associated endonuclease Cas1 [Methanoregula sp.]|uniref:CRISPR-associated endonuclease Cas1 n=1 Tax=Methanoregula sp. TaxID=2052170 RepID=UPI0025DFE581|nr:CRISPR-associated endonuclease Cas1 [Methanoregula sp.]